MDKQAKRQLREQQQLNIDLEQRALEKAARRAEKALRREQRQEPVELVPTTQDIDVACLIHSNGYSWDYVEKLYNSVRRNLARNIRFHVYTEHDRSVPPYMIKHCLTEIPDCAGPRKSWWYKLQLFNSQHHAGPLLYFDLDTVIVGRLDWITELSTKYFWAPRDYRHLWRSTHKGINSSVMWWDTRRFDHVWSDFQIKDFGMIRKTFHGDQDYVSSVIHENLIRYFLPFSVMSWRWQVKDGGMNFRNRLYVSPGSGTTVDHRTSVLVFHGLPKPHEVPDPVIKNFWQ